MSASSISTGAAGAAFSQFSTAATRQAPGQAQVQDTAFEPAAADTAPDAPTPRASSAQTVPPPASSGRGTSIDISA